MLEGMQQLHAATFDITDRMHAQWILGSCLLTGFNNILFPETPWQRGKLGGNDRLGASLLHEVLQELL